VFLDERRLQPGRRSQDDFIQSIVNSTIVVPIFSFDALATIVKHDPSVVDSVLLEWICAIEGYKSDYSRIKYIYPLFRGKEDPVTGKVGSVFDCEEFKQIPDIIPQATLSAAESLLTANDVFSRAPTGFATMTVKSIVMAIKEFKGLSVDDDKQKNFLTICADNLVKMLDDHLSKPSVPDPNVFEMIDMEIDDDNIEVPALLQMKPLSEFSVDDVTHLLKSLNLRRYRTLFRKNKIDGPTLINCKSVDDVKELGIDLAPKARILFEKIVQLKSTLLSEENHLEVPAIINCDEETSEITENSG